MTPIILQITRRRGIYRVTRDGVFHGDYTRKLWAREGVEEAAHKLRQQGRCVEIVMSKDDV